MVKGGEGGVENFEGIIRVSKVQEILCRGKEGWGCSPIVACWEGKGYAKLGGKFDGACKLARESEQGAGKVICQRVSVPSPKPGKGRGGSESLETILKRERYIFSRGSSMKGEEYPIGGRKQQGKEKFRK